MLSDTVIPPVIAASADAHDRDAGPVKAKAEAGYCMSAVGPYQLVDRFRTYFSQYQDSANFESLKENILRTGVLKALVVWVDAEGSGIDILLDGYHRDLAITQLRLAGHDVADPPVKRMHFKSMAEAKLWLIEHQSSERPQSIEDKVARLENDAELSSELAEQAKKNQKKGVPLSDVGQRGGVLRQKAAKAGISHTTYHEYATVMKNPKAVQMVREGRTTYHKAFKSMMHLRKKVQEEHATLKAQQVLPDWTNKTTGTNSIVQCDVLNGFPLADSSVDLWVTSPPYPIENRKVPYIVPFFEGTYGGDGERTYLSKIRKVIRECYRTLKPDRYLVINIDNCGPTSDDRKRGIRQYNCFKDLCIIGESEGFIYSDVHHWYKQKAVSNRPLMGSRDNPRGQRNVEFIIVFYKPGTKDSPDRPSNNDLSMEEFHKLTMAHWDITPNQAERNKWKHPAPFPFALVERVVKLYSRRGEVVGDCFNGVGTTTAAAIANGRQYVGLEINQVFCERARLRVVEATRLADERVAAARVTKVKVPQIEQMIKTHATWDGKRARSEILAGERELAATECSTSPEL